MPPDLDFDRLLLFCIAQGLVFGILIGTANLFFTPPIDVGVQSAISGGLGVSVILVLLQQFRQGRHQWLRRSGPRPPRA